MRRFYNTTDINTQHKIPPIPPVKQPKKEKIRRIYEDNDFVVDLFAEDNALRVSIFEDGHFKDEVFIKKSEYIN